MKNQVEKNDYYKLLAMKLNDIEEFIMKFSYKKLWKLLIDRDIKHKDLIDKIGISRSTFYKLKKDENVNTEVLLKI